MEIKLPVSELKAALPALVPPVEDATAPGSG